MKSTWKTAGNCTPGTRKNWNCRLNMGITFEALCRCSDTWLAFDGDSKDTFALGLGQTICTLNEQQTTM